MPSLSFVFVGEADVTPLSPPLPHPNGLSPAGCRALLCHSHVTDWGSYVNPPNGSKLNVVLPKKKKTGKHFRRVRGSPWKGMESSGRVTAIEAGSGSTACAFESTVQPS